MNNNKKSFKISKSDSLQVISYIFLNNKNLKIIDQTGSKLKFERGRYWSRRAGGWYPRLKGTLFFDGNGETEVELNYSNFSKKYYASVTIIFSIIGILLSYFAFPPHQSINRLLLLLGIFYIVAAFLSPFLNWKIIKTHENLFTNKIFDLFSALERGEDGNIIYSKPIRSLLRDIGYTIELFIILCTIIFVILIIAGKG